MLINLWKSTFSNTVYEMPTDWLPAKGMIGWELIGTIQRN